MSSKQNQNSNSILLVDRKSSFIPLYVGVGVPCLPISTLALHKVHILLCIAQHLLVELGRYLAICHLKVGQLVSNMDVV